MELLHFDGPVWRPPYEAHSQLLQVTAGCTHAKCRFCSLYYGTHFRLSPRSEVEEDLGVIREWQPRARRLFLTGANPFVLSYRRLHDLGRLIESYLPRCVSIGCFARITDIAAKTDDELASLRRLGFDGLSIGTESGDDSVLEFMRKGYAAEEILKQCRRLEQAGIAYNLTYMLGLAGRGGGGRNARETARIYGQLHPVTVNVVSLTVFAESELHADVCAGRFEEAGEVERLEELRTLVAELGTRTTILADTVSNSVPVIGMLPYDRARILRELDSAIVRADEEEMSRRRRGIVSL